MDGWATTGDSLELSGFVLGVLASYAGSPSVLTDPWYFSTFVTTYKAAAGATDCVDTLGQFTTYVLPTKSTNYKHNVVSIGCGHNDFLHGTSAASSYSSILATVVAAKAAGFTVIVGTVMDAIDLNSGAGATYRSALNASITGGAVANGYSVADVSADANLGCNNCYLDGTYFLPDGVHLTTTGWAKKATYTAPILTALGFN